MFLRSIGFRHILPALLLLAFCGVVSLTAAETVTAVAGSPSLSGYVPLDTIQQRYGLKQKTRKGSSITLENSKVRMQLSIGGYECLLNRVKFVFSDKVIEENGRVYLSKMDQIKLIDPVLRPQLGTSHGPFQTVILDPGHGGSDPGALNSLGTEARYNLILAREVKRQLEAAGYKVILTRQTDQYLSLEERVRRANALRANAVFVSLHFNSGRSHARGIETFTLSPPGVSHYGRDLLQSDQIQRTGNRQDSANIALATAVHGSVLGALGTHTLDRGIKRARFTVLSGVRHPAILFEGGFMSHPSEARLIHREDHRKRLAAGIVQGVRRYQNAIKSRGKAGQRLP